MSKIMEDIMQKRVHFFVSESQLVAAFVAAGFATFIATMLGEWFPAFGWTPFSFNTLNGEVWAQNWITLSGFFPVITGTKLSPDFAYSLGAFAHYSQGFLFGLLFVFIVHPNLPGRLTQRNNLLKGIIWGLTLWLVSSSLVMPLLYGSGFLFSVWGQQNLFYNFVWHAAWGVNIGLLYNPLPKPQM